LFDLSVGDPTVRPDAAAGRAACEAATAAAVELGLVGAGTGATVGKWGGWDGVTTGGLGGAVRRHGELVVASLVAVNALGAVDDGASSGLEPAQLADAGWLPDAPDPRPPDAVFGNTTIGIVV